MLFFTLLFCLAILPQTMVLAAPQQHTNNWAVLVATSRFWFNYRHIANTLSIYHTVKRLGIPDSQIILMLADDMPCNARNSHPAEVFNSDNHLLNLYGEDVEVDYRGTEVSVEAVLRLLTGRHPQSFPSSKTLNTNEHSNILVYMSGHGGDQFLKFHDYEEISSNDLSDAIKEMHVKKRYNEIFFMTDTCQAATLAKAITSPNVLTIGSSKLGENSYGGGPDYDVGVSLIDRFTDQTLDFFERMSDSIKQAQDSCIGKDKSKQSQCLAAAQARASATYTMQGLFNHYNPRHLLSHPEVRSDLYHRDLKQVPVTDFFGSVLRVEPYMDSYRFSSAPAAAGIVDTSEEKQKQTQKQKQKQKGTCTPSAAKLMNTNNNKDRNRRYDRDTIDLMSGGFWQQAGGLLVIVVALVLRG